MNSPAPRAASHVPLSRWLLLWAFASGLAFICALYLLSLTLANGEFVPGDHDSFYHARRILHAVTHWPALYQFDALIHAPEGSWLTWPWGFDFTLALIVKALLGLGVSVKPISILVFVAPCWVLVNAGLMLAIGVRLRLGLVPAALVMLAFATSSLTLALHHVGMIDHHFVELSFVLATLYCGLGWLEAPENAGKACWLGLWLGLAPAFHNGDFILQLPVLGSLAVLWWLRKPPPLRASAAFAFTLLAVSALALLPSEPFRRLMYSYTLHSWFHLHVAACTASAALVLSGPRTGRRALWLVACVAAGLPILGEMQLGSEFLLGRLEQLSGMTEVTGVVDYLRAGEFARLFELYSLLICLLPAGVAWVVWRAWRERSPARIFLAVYTLFGSTLLLLQFRLEYFGSFALWLLPALYVEERWLASGSPHGRRALLALAVLMPLAMLPGLKILTQPMPLGGDVIYRPFLPLFAQLHERCAVSPGVVLAVNTLGHYLSYHSDCGVISDNFILTRQHEEKLRLTNELMTLSLADALRKAPYIRYVLVSRADAAFTDSCFPECAANAGLRHELLEGNPVAPNLRLLGEVAFEKGSRREPLARLFEITP